MGNALHAVSLLHPLIDREIAVNVSSCALWSKVPNCDVILRVSCTVGHRFKRYSTQGRVIEAPWGMGDELRPGHIIVTIQTGKQFLRKLNKKLLRSLILKFKHASSVKVNWTGVKYHKMAQFLRCHEPEQGLKTEKMLSKKPLRCFF